MPVISELIRTENNASISFGNYRLDKKTKHDNFEFNGDIYKVKTFKEITKLERNGMFVYESVPGTAVNGFIASDDGVEFTVEGDNDAQITLELADDTEYQIFIDGEETTKMKTNMSGKLTLSVELEANENAVVKIVRD